MFQSQWILVLFIVNTSINDGLGIKLLVNQPPKERTGTTAITVYQTILGSVM